MLKFYKTTAVEKKLKKAKTITENSWIDMVSPDREEIEQVVKITGIDEDLILKMLDDEERPRIEESGNGYMGKHRRICALFQRVFKFFQGVLPAE